MRILICGGGVIGVSIAWVLAKRGGEPVVIERTGTANAASGKSGGFLALDWSDGTALAPLARRSAVSAPNSHQYLSRMPQIEQIDQGRVFALYEPNFQRLQKAAHRQPEVVAYHDQTLKAPAVALPAVPTAKW